MSDELSIDSGALIFATLADVYLSSGMVDEAISILKDGLSRNPTYTLAKIILGRAYYMKGDIEDSIKILEQTYPEAKDSENLNVYLAHCYKKKGDVEKAVRHYEQALKVNPQNKEAMQEMKVLKPDAIQQVSVQETGPVESEVVKIVEAIKTQAEPIDKQGEPTVESVKPAEPEVKPEPHVPEEIKTEPVEIEPAKPVEPEVKIEKPTAPKPSEEFIDIHEPKKEDVIRLAEIVPGKIEEQEKTAPVPFVTEYIGDEVPASLQPVKEESEKPVKRPEVSVVPSIPLATLDGPINKLLNNKTVKGAFICSKDGLPIQSYCKDRTDVDEISAMIAAIYNEAHESFKFLKEGEVEKFIIEKDDETLCVITAGESLLTVITQPEAKPGLVFVYARKIIEEIREILG